MLSPGSYVTLLPIAADELTSLQQYIGRYVGSFVCRDRMMECKHIFCESFNLMSVCLSVAAGSCLLITLRSVLWWIIRSDRLSSVILSV